MGHLPKEENILFPYIKKMINELKLKEKSEKPFFGTIQNPISVMHAEHDEAGRFCTVYEKSQTIILHPKMPVTHIW